MIRPSRELVDAVAKQLSETAVRDTDLKETDEFKDGDSIAIVQDGTNKRILASPLVDYIKKNINLDDIAEDLERKIEDLKVQVGDTEYWDSIQYIPKEGQIIVYTDKESKEIDGETVYFPGIKIGSGHAYVQDLAFIGDDIASDLLTHINDTDMHVSEQDRSLWNNKLNVIDFAEVNNGVLIFNRN